MIQKKVYIKFIMMAIFLTTYVECISQEDLRTLVNFPRIINSNFNEELQVGSFLLNSKYFLGIDFDFNFGEENRIEKILNSLYEFDLKYFISNRQNYPSREEIIDSLQHMVKDYNDSDPNLFDNVLEIIRLISPLILDQIYLNEQSYIDEDNWILTWEQLELGNLQNLPIYLKTIQDLIQKVGSQFYKFWYNLKFNGHPSISIINQILNSKENQGKDKMLILQQVLRFLQNQWIKNDNDERKVLSNTFNHITQIVLNFLINDNQDLEKQALIKQYIPVLFNIDHQFQIFLLKLFNNKVSTMSKLVIKNFFEKLFKKQSDSLMDEYDMKEQQDILVNLISKSKNFDFLSGEQLQNAINFYQNNLLDILKNFNVEKQKNYQIILRYMGHLKCQDQNASKLDDEIYELYYTMYQIINAYIHEFEDEELSNEISKLKMIQIDNLIQFMETNFDYFAKNEEMNFNKYYGYIRLSLTQLFFEKDNFQEIQFPVEQAPQESVQFVQDLIKNDTCQNRIALLNLIQIIMLKKVHINENDGYQDAINLVKEMFQQTEVKIRNIHGVQQRNYEKIQKNEQKVINRKNKNIIFDNLSRLKKMEEENKNKKQNDQEVNKETESIEIKENDNLSDKSDSSILIKKFGSQENSIEEISNEEKNDLEIPNKDTLDQEQEKILDEPNHNSQEKDSNYVKQMTEEFIKEQSLEKNKVDLGQDENIHDQSFEKTVNSPINEQVYINEPVNEPNNEPLNDSVNEPVNDSVNDSVNEPVNEPVNDSVNEPVNEHINEPLNDSVNEPVNDSVNEPVNEPVNDSVNQPVNEPVNEQLEKSIEEFQQNPISEQNISSQEIASKQTKDKSPKRIKKNPKVLKPSEDQSEIANKKPKKILKKPTPIKSTEMKTKIKKDISVPQKEKVQQKNQIKRMKPLTGVQSKDEHKKSPKLLAQDQKANPTKNQLKRPTPVKSTDVKPRLHQKPKDSSININKKPQKTSVIKQRPLKNSNSQDTLKPINKLEDNKHKFEYLKRKPSKYPLPKSGHNRQPSDSSVSENKTPSQRNSVKRPSNAMRSQSALETHPGDNENKPKFNYLKRSTPSNLRKPQVAQSSSQNKPKKIFKRPNQPKITEQNQEEKLDMKQNIEPQIYQNKSQIIEASDEQIDSPVKSPEIHKQKLSENQIAYFDGDLDDELQQILQRPDVRDYLQQFKDVNGEIKLQLKNGDEIIFSMVDIYLDCDEDLFSKHDMLKLQEAYI